MFVASTELLNIVSLHVCREQASSVDTDPFHRSIYHELPRIISSWLGVRCKGKFPILLLTYIFDGRESRCKDRYYTSNHSRRGIYIYLLGIVKGVYKWNGISLCSRRRRRQVYTTVARTKTTRVNLTEKSPSEK